MTNAVNPKDALAHRKVPLGLLPALADIEGARAMAVGAAKYGAYNWRSTRVTMSVYLDAMKRHYLALLDGEDFDRESGVPHFGHIIANAAIALDAIAVGTMVDDRFVGPAADFLEQYTEPAPMPEPETPEPTGIFARLGGIFAKAEK